MIRVFVVLAVIAGVAGAAELADPTVGFRVEIPHDLPPSADLTAAVVRDFSDSNRFGGAPYRANGKAYADPEAGLALYVLWLTTEKPVTDPGGLVRGEILDKKDVPSKVVGADQVEVVSWTDAVEGTLATAALEFKHNGSQTRTLMRTAMFADAEGKLHEIDVECVLREDAAERARKACAEALASLTITVPESGRMALGDAPVAAPVAAAPSAPAAQAPAAAPTSNGGVLVVNDQARKPRSPRRWYLIGGGALIVVAVAVAMRRRKVETA